MSSGGHGGLTECKKQGTPAPEILGTVVGTCSFSERSGYPKSGAQLAQNPAGGLRNGQRDGQGGAVAAGRPWGVFSCHIQAVPETSLLSSSHQGLFWKVIVS